MNKFFAIFAVAALMSPAAFADNHAAKGKKAKPAAAGAHADEHAADAHAADAHGTDAAHTDTHAKPAAPAKK
jgi:hypothetical protein